jgi:hypothetical protein
VELLLLLLKLNQHLSLLLRLLPELLELPEVPQQVEPLWLLRVPRRLHQRPLTLLKPLVPPHQRLLLLAECKLIYIS